MTLVSGSLQLCRTGVIAVLGSLGPLKSGQQAAVEFNVEAKSVPPAFIAVCCFMHCVLKLVFSTSALLLGLLQGLIPHTLKKIIFCTFILQILFHALIL